MKKMIEVSILLLLIFFTIYFIAVEAAIMGFIGLIIFTCLVLYFLITKFRYNLEKIKAYNFDNYVIRYLFGWFMLVICIIAIIGYFISLFKG